MNGIAKWRRIFLLVAVAWHGVKKVKADIAAGKFISLEEGLRLRREQRAKK